MALMLISNKTEIVVPQHFQDGRPIQQVILICDVDGVIRDSTEGDADTRIISAIKELIADQKLDVTFISGTSITQNSLLETWRRGNISLDKAVGRFLLDEMKKNRVTIFGALGGQKMTSDGHVEFTDVYSSDVAFEIGKILLLAFLEEVTYGSTQQQNKFVKDLKIKIAELRLKNKQQPSTITADEFKEVISQIHSQFDPYFRLVSNGAFVESQTSNPPWTTSRSSKWIKNQLDSPDWLISKIPEEQKQIAMGLAHRENKGFNFLMVSKTNKGITIKKHLQEKLRQYPDALIVTIGDTQIDFPMHQHAHWAFHVGQKQVWQNHSLPHCMLVQDKFGRDSQHVAGTLYVLSLLKKNIGKSIFDWNITS